MNIAVLLHAGAGGSGVVATELGLSFAREGHQVHFVSDRVPFRLGNERQSNVWFHQVESLAYPLFDAPLTTLSEASKLAEVVEEYDIDVVHAHYAVPHATAAVLARDMVRTRRPAVVTTLHGTDVTLVGIDRAYLRATQHAIERSDLVTAVSRHLAEVTRRDFDVARDVRVIPNPVDVNRFTPGFDPDVRLRYAHPDERLLVHVSNFRKVKRVQDVIGTLARLNSGLTARLLMIGDGPERPRAVQAANELGVAGRVAFLGSFPRIEDLLAVSDLFLLPSAQEAFGLSALEAMASGVPVVASRAGGLPEVVEDGVTGYLREVGDVDGMARAAADLLRDRELHGRMARAARERALRLFSEDAVLPRYKEAYEEAALSASPQGA